MHSPLGQTIALLELLARGTMLIGVVWGCSVSWVGMSLEDWGSVRWARSGSLELVCCGLFFFLKCVFESWVCSLYG